MKTRLVPAVAAAAVAAAGLTALQAAPAAALPNCPHMVSHGWYDGAMDHVLPMNNPGANMSLDGTHTWFQQQRTWKSTYIEGDLRWTSDGKAIMWHNKTTNGLNDGGTHTSIKYTPWSSLSGLTIGKSDSATINSPYAGKKIWSLDDWLNALQTAGIRPVIELKQQPPAGGWAQIVSALNAHTVDGISMNSSRTRIWSSDADGYGWSGAADQAAIMADIKSKLTSAGGSTVDVNTVSSFGGNWQSMADSGKALGYVDGGFKPISPGQVQKGSNEKTPNQFIAWVNANPGHCTLRPEQV